MAKWNGLFSYRIRGGLTIAGMVPESALAAVAVE